jgi:hypothetical protein
MASEYLEPRQPPGSYYRREYWFDSPGSSAPFIQDPLYEVLELMVSTSDSFLNLFLIFSVWY